MWASLLPGILSRPWARQVAGLVLVVLTIILFMINLRRMAERAGRAAERLETLERTNAIHHQMPHAALVAATIFLTGCAGGSFDTAPSACPPLVEYSRAEQAGVAAELAALPEGAVIAEWLADYAVLRDQARACRSSLANH